MSQSNIISLTSQPTQEEIWSYIQNDPEKVSKLLEIAHQVFLPEYIGSQSRKFVNASVKSSYYLLNLANEIGDKCDLVQKTNSELLSA